MRPSPNTRLRWPRRAVPAALAAAAVLVLAACGTQTAGPQQAHQPGASSVAGPPTATLTTLAGNTVRVPGSKPTALFFFTAARCEECAEGAKSLANAAAKVGAKAQFLAVDVDPHDSADAITGFLRSIGSPDLPAAIDQGAAISRTYQVSAISTVIVVDPSGKVTFRGTASPADKIEAALTAAGAK